MLETHAGGCCQSENAEGRDNAHAVSTSCCAVDSAATLPLTSNEGCCGPTFGTGEVAGSNGSRHVRGLGKELPLIAGGTERGVTTGCGCGPHGNSTDRREDCQSPLGVNLLDGSPLNIDVRDDVADVEPVVVNPKDGTPECCPDGETKGCCHGQASEQSGNVSDQGCLCHGENNPGHYTEHATESGTKHRHGLHSVTEVSR